MRWAYPSQCGDGSRKHFVWGCDGEFWECIWTVRFWTLGVFTAIYRTLDCIVINDWGYLLIPSSVLLRCGVMWFGSHVHYRILPKTRCKTPPDRYNSCVTGLHVKCLCVRFERRVENVDKFRYTFLIQISRKCVRWKSISLRTAQKICLLAN